MTLSRAGTALLFLFAIGSAGCASTAPATSYDGLERIRTRSLDQAWVRPGFEPAFYERIMFRGGGVRYLDVPEGRAARVSSQTRFPLSAEDQARFEATMAEAFRAELADLDSYEIVTEPTPGTLRLDIALIDVASHVPPDRLGRVEVFIADVASATLVLEFSDAMTGAVLFRGTDARVASRQGSEFTRSASTTDWRVIERLARRWASGLRDGIDEMHTSGDGR